MAHELPPRVMSSIKQKMYEMHNMASHEGKTNIQHSNNLARLSATRQVDEPSPQQARAINKILS